MKSTEAERSAFSLQPSALRLTDGQIHLTETGPMTAEQFFPIMAEHGIGQALIVPPRGVSPEYGLGCVDRYPGRFAVMGWYEPGVDLARWRDHPGMKAIRLWLDAPDWQRFRRGGDLVDFFATAERIGLPVSVFTLKGLPGFASVARRFSGLRIIVDHANLIGAQPYEIRRRQAELLDLAAEPNVWVKLSGMPAFSGTTFPYPDIQPLLREAFQAFGAGRLLWGSDYTLVQGRGKGDYGQILAFALDTLRPIATNDDLEQIFHRTIGTVLNGDVGS